MHIQCKNAFHKKSLCIHILWPWQSCFYVKNVESKLLSWHGHKQQARPSARSGFGLFFFLCRWPRSPKQHLPSHSRQSSQGTKYVSSGCLTGCFFCFSKFQLILGRGFSTWAHGFVSTRGRCEKAQLRLVGCCVMWKPTISGGERVWEIWLSNIAKIAYKPLVCLKTTLDTGWQMRWNILMSVSMICFLCRGKHDWASRMARTIYGWLYTLTKKKGPSETSIDQGCGARKRSIGCLMWVSHSPHIDYPPEQLTAGN